ncbi:MAG: hypothetical protein HT580_16670 [Dechloromonas sp.]|nr:MAG: hypothetical protein HT580_16670 [Dechloromonas sp.]
MERGVEVKLPTAEPVATDAENVTLSTAVRVIRDVIQERGPIARQALAIELDALLKMAREADMAETILGEANLDGESLALLREGSEAFVGVLATVSSGTLDESDTPLQ